MMTEDKLQTLLKRFAIAAKNHCLAMEEMDEEKAHRHGIIIARLFEEIIGEGQSGREGLLALADSEDQAVAGMAAVYSMRYRPDRCIRVLERLSSEPGLLGFRASMALEHWQTGKWELD